MPKSIIALAYEAGIRPFDPIPQEVAKRTNVGDIAAFLLSGRNPYFDKEYRDRFGTKVHSLELTHHRLVLGAIESAVDARTSVRRYRAVIFRCDGEVLYQTSDTRPLDDPAARVDLRYYQSQINEVQLLHELLTLQARKMERLRLNAEHALDALRRQGP
jgi:hypothetical protein